jgi:hypothetical protein
MISDATISPCGLYRYTLSRIVAGGDKRILFVGLNPSTADASLDDPTIRRMKAFAAQMGGGLLLVGNLFAYRATEPKELWRLPKDVAIGPENDAHLARLAQQADVVIAAWGSAADRTPRGGTVLGILKKYHRGAVQCLGRTQNGWPKHPLYLKKDTQLEVY